MISEDLEKAINDQINLEFTASYHYLGMAAHFETKNLDGFASWMQVQHDEEIQHGMRLYRYLLDRGGKIALESIEKPAATFSSIISVFETALEMEQSNTRAINELYELATRLNDHATKSHLQWFIDEQVEEEKSIEDILGLLNLSDGDTSALLLLNDKLGARSSAQSAPASTAAG